jgi:putative multiple sugar transport system substrate-binding protein
VCVRDGALAKKRLDVYLSECYPENVPDILVTGSDEIAGTVWETLEASGRLVADALPLITGLDVTEAGVKQILAGQQSISTYRSDPERNEHCVTAVQTVMAGESLAHLSTVCDNGLKLVPSFLTEAVIVDGENYRRVLANSGIDTE